jgi:hypothetical protein
MNMRIIEMANADFQSEGPYGHVISDINLRNRINEVLAGQLEFASARFVRAEEIPSAFDVMADAWGSRETPAQRKESPDDPDARPILRRKDRGLSAASARLERTMGNAVLASAGRGLGQAGDRRVDGRD